MLPFWLYTLGGVFMEGQDELDVPFQMVAVSLSVLILPLIGGVFLKQRFPKAADRLQKLLKPVIVVMALVLIVVGISANAYIFRLFKLKIIAAACLLPYVGYVCGGVVATIFRQPWDRIKTISIETGMQNTSIAYILLINSFPSPSGDIAAVAPVASAVMTPLPPFLVTICYMSYQYWKKRNGPAHGETDNEIKRKSKGDAEFATDGAGETLMTELTSIDTSKADNTDTEIEDTELVKPTDDDHADNEMSSDVHSKGT